MTITAAMLDALLAAGATAEMIVAAVKADIAERDEQQTRKREKDAERQRRHRMSRDVTVTACDTPLSPKKVSPKPPSKNTPEPPLPFPNGNGCDFFDQKEKAQEKQASSFEGFWSAYPKRTGGNPKKPAKARFEAALRDGADPQDLIAAAHRLAAQHPTPSVYVPMTATWLNQERWKDEATGPPVETVIRFPTVEEIFAEVEERKRAKAAAANGGNPDVPGAGQDQRLRVAK